MTVITKERYNFQINQAWLMAFSACSNGRLVYPIGINWFGLALILTDRCPIRSQISKCFCFDLVASQSRRDKSKYTQCLFSDTRLKSVELWTCFYFWLSCRHTFTIRAQWTRLSNCIIISFNAVIVPIRFRRSQWPRPLKARVARVAVVTSTLPSRCSLEDE